MSWILKGILLTRSVMRRMLHRRAFFRSYLKSPGCCRWYLNLGNRRQDVPLTQEKVLVSTDVSFSRHLTPASHLHAAAGQVAWESLLWINFPRCLSCTSSTRRHPAWRDISGIWRGWELPFWESASTPSRSRWWRTPRSFRAEWRRLNINTLFLARLWKKVSTSSWPMTRADRLAASREGCRQVLPHVKRWMSQSGNPLTLLKHLKRLSFCWKYVAVNLNQSLAKILSQSRYELVS